MANGSPTLKERVRQESRRRWAGRASWRLGIDYPVRLSCRCEFWLPQPLPLSMRMGCVQHGLQYVVANGRNR